MYNSKIYVIESIHIDFGKSTVHRIGGMLKKIVAVCLSILGLRPRLDNLHQVKGASICHF